MSWCHDNGFSVEVFDLIQVFNFIIRVICLTLNQFHPGLLLTLAVYVFTSKSIHLD